MAISREHRQILIQKKNEKLLNREFCANRHPWIKENIKIKTDGRRACIICSRIDCKNRAKLRRGTIEGKLAKRNTVLKSTYGITLKDYNILLENQNHKCAICGRKQEEFTRKFAVDHCHITDKVRGLLYGNCNVGIGNLQDDVNILEKAIKYLKNDN